MPQQLWKKTLAFGFAFAVTSAFAQDSTDLFTQALLESRQEDQDKTEVVEATFKATRIINGNSVETTKAGLLDFRVAHRFGFLNQGLYDFFGLDNATTRLSLDYGITNRLMVGIGRSTFQKQMDMFAKYKLLQQTRGKHVMPVSLSLLASAIIRTQRESDPTVKRSLGDKTTYAFQAILARKLNENTSLQLMPTLVHYNLAPVGVPNNDQVSLGAAARQRISKRVSITAEYYYQFDQPDGTYNSIGIGVDIETGGHVFQLHLTNSTGMTERTFINETTGNFWDGDIHFGFNISRVFRIKKYSPAP
jgi:hypothetical protein